jgi:hypothetical protein
LFSTAIYSVSSKCHTNVPAWADMLAKAASPTAAPQQHCMPAAPVSDVHTNNLQHPARMRRRHSTRGMDDCRRTDAPEHTVHQCYVNTACLLLAASRPAIQKGSPGRQTGASQHVLINDSACTCSFWCKSNQDAATRRLYSLRGPDDNVAIHHFAI